VPNSGTPRIYPLWRYNRWESEDNRKKLQEIGYHFEGGELIVNGEAFLVFPVGLLEGTGFAVLVPFDALAESETASILKYAISATPQSSAHRKARANFWKTWWATNVPELVKPEVN
jgi:hypothetical protein